MRLDSRYHKLATPLRRQIAHPLGKARIGRAGEMHLFQDRRRALHIIETRHGGTQAFAILFRHRGRHTKFLRRLQKHGAPVDHGLALVHGGEKPLLHIDNQKLGCGRIKQHENAPKLDRASLTTGGPQPTFITIFITVGNAMGVSAGTREV